MKDPAHRRADRAPPASDDERAVALSAGPVVRTHSVALAAKLRELDGGAGPVYTTELTLEELRGEGASAGKARLYGKLDRDNEDEHAVRVLGWAARVGDDGLADVPDRKALRAPARPARAMVFDDNTTLPLEKPDIEMVRRGPGPVGDRPVDPRHAVRARPRPRHAQLEAHYTDRRQDHAVARAGGGSPAADRLGSGEDFHRGRAGTRGGRQVSRGVDETKRNQRGFDLTRAHRLPANARVAFVADRKGGPFDVPGDQTRMWLLLPANPNGHSNADVLKPWVNGMNVTRPPAGKRTVDSGWTMSDADAPGSHRASRRDTQAPAERDNPPASWSLSRRRSIRSTCDPREAFRR